MDRMARESEQLSTSVVHRLESGSGAVTVTALYRYAEALNLPPKALLDFPFPSIEARAEPLVVGGAEAPKGAFRTHLPVYSLKAAAGHFGLGEAVEPLGWVEVRDRGALRKNMFVARAVGHSMEPKIRDNDFLVFRADPEGTRQGRIVLAQFRGVADPDTGGSFTVKVYSSVRVPGREGVRKQVLLLPLNPDYEPIRIDSSRAEDFRILAEYLFTL
jgi:SOS-response transcriptional repressor LexA